VAILADDSLFVADSESSKEIFGELQNPGWKNGVRFGGASDGSLRGFIDGTDPEGLAVDQLGNVWAGLTSTPILQKWVKR
jgi:sugar lactone lactonase YvrE